MTHSQIDGGYQLWARKTLESEIFVDKPAEWFKLWFYLVMSVHWSDDKRLPRGSIHITYRHTADILRITENQIDSFFRHARLTAMLTTRKTTRGVIVSLLGYEKYQDPENYKTATQTARRPTRDRYETATIDKEGKKETKKEGATGEGEPAAPPPSPTPRDETRAFFESEEKQQAIISWLLSRGTSEDAAKRELASFISYWTEPTPNGKRQRWETERAFEIKRRLVTWFTRAARDGQRGAPKPSQQWHVAQ